MEELMERLEKAKKELDEAYKTEDWDYILACSMDVYAIERQMETTM